MSSIFLATLGQRPEAVTIALDTLLPRYPIERIGILHTEPQTSGIASAFAKLQTVLAADYPQMVTVYHELCFENGDPLLDITNEHSAEAYYLSVLHILREYRIMGYTIHLMVAGGRKAMSIYATLAASLVFGGQDCVWTVLSSSEVMQPNLYHIPVGYRADVHLVRLPILPSRFLRGTLAEIDIDALLEQRNDPKARFLAILSREEIRLLELLKQHPHATNERFAELLQKADKTIEHQFRSIYHKMEKFYDVPRTHKRAILLDILTQ